MDGALAMIEREYRKFRRTPRLIAMTMVMPILQLVILGYAFGGVVKRLRVGVVDQDHGVPALKLREMANAVSANAQTFELQPYADLGQAVHALRDGAINGVLAIPPDFSRRTLSQRDPHIALIEDNTDSFVANTLAGTFSSLTQNYKTQVRPSSPRLDLVEVYPYIPYIQYLLPGSICMSIFMMVMMGGGIIYIDDKMRGLHEGYLVTPITRFELIIGFTVSGAAKAIVSGVVLMTVGSLIAGVADPFAPMRLLRLFVVIVFTAMALMSMMFLIMVRMNDPLLPRAMFGVLNTVLYFPSGAVYPTQAFPGWMRAIAAADPFTYSVHAMKCLLLKNTGFSAILPDLTFLLIFSIIAMTGATLLFRRSL